MHGSEDREVQADIAGERVVVTSQRLRGGFHRLALFLAAGLLLLQIGAKADENHINRPRLTWSAFECSTYASVARKDIESQRLFELGMQTGRSSLEAMQNGTLPASEREDAPVGMLFVLQGPVPILSLVAYSMPPRITHSNGSQNATGLNLTLPSG
jgi:hypothetical protein